MFGVWPGLISVPPTYVDIFCYTFGQLFAVWSYVVMARQNGGEINHSRRAEIDDVLVVQK